MHPDATSSNEFANFDPHLARAVVAVLRARGIRAWIDEGRAQDHGSLPVQVPADAHEAAIATLARHMEEIHALAGQGRERDEARRRRPAGDHQDDEPETGPPLVMERFRSAGLLIALVLAPLLVVTLAQTPMSRGIALGIVVLGAIVLAALRQRRT